jgi:hypothetical protein
MPGEKEVAGEGEGQPGDITALRDSLLAGVREGAGPAAEAEARALLDYVLTITSVDGPPDRATYIDQVVSRSIPFIEQAEDSAARHLRLLGVTHVLLNLLKPQIESSDDELLSSEFEDLRDKLVNLDRVNGFNPSVDNDLELIYRGLVELSSALCLTSCPPLWP